MEDQPRVPSIAALGPVARHIVFGPDNDDEGDDPATTAAWRQEVPAIVAERASGLAIRHLQRVGSELDAADLAGLVAELSTFRRRDSMDALAISALTLPFLEILAAHGIGSVVIKGVAVARHYPSTELRPFRDVDIVVAPERFEEARSLARTAGLEPAATDLQPHASFDLRCREGINLSDPTGRMRLDLHHHVGPWALGRRLTFARLLQHAQPLHIHGSTIMVAGPEHSLAVAVLHLISEQWQKKLSLITWSDVRVLGGVVEPAAAAAELRALRLDGLVAAVLANLPLRARPAGLVRELGSPTIPVDVRLRLGRLDASSIVGRHPAGWAARLPVGNAAWFLLGSMVPSRAYLRSRFGEDASYGTWWRLAVRWARQAVRGQDVTSPYAAGREP